MAKREALRDLQARLAERLQAVRSQPRGVSYLAVESAGHGFLLPLEQAGEIFGVGPLVPVPHAVPWFLGVANLRGHVYGVVDLARFFGLRRDGTEALRQPAQLVVFNPSIEMNCALLVDRLAGLRHAEQLAPRPDDGAPRPAFVGHRYADDDGRDWQVLDLPALAADEAFVKIMN